MSAQVTVPVVPCADVTARLNEGLIIDVRTPAEFREVHMLGSVNIPLVDLSRFVSELKAKAAGQEGALDLPHGQAGHGSV